MKPARCQEEALRFGKLRTKGGLHDVVEEGVDGVDELHVGLHRLQQPPELPLHRMAAQPSARACSGVSAESGQVAVFVGCTLELKLSASQCRASV